MAGKSSREILMEDLEKMDEGIKSLAETNLVRWLCKAMRDVLLYVIGDIDRRRIKEEHRD